MRKAEVIILSVVTILFYQNFSFRKLDKAMDLKPVNEEIRIDHAKELLGKYYEDSPVYNTKGIKYVNLHTYNLVHGALPKKYKYKARIITKTIIEESKKFNFDPIFVAAVIKTESNFNPMTIGTVGEIGLMQLRPETAQWITEKKKMPWKGKNSLFNVVENVKQGVRYLAFLRSHFNNKAYKYLSAYNIGPEKVKRLFDADIVPKDYPIRVMKNYEEFYSEIASYNKSLNLAANDKAKDKEL